LGVLNNFHFAVNESVGNKPVLRDSLSGTPDKWSRRTHSIFHVIVFARHAVAPPTLDWGHPLCTRVSPHDPVREGVKVY
jgi:hypothetical protein